MNDRILLVLKAKNITPAQFADELGVQRSGISHILNGRNKPSLDFIQKVLKRYSDISINWLMFGDGPMFNANGNDLNKFEKPLSIQSIDPKSEKVEKQSNKSTLQPSLIDLFDSDEEIEKDNESGINESEFDTFPDDMPINSYKRGESEVEKHLSKKTLKDNAFTAKGTINKKIIRIVIFYDDKSFSDYTPE